MQSEYLNLRNCDVTHEIEILQEDLQLPISEQYKAFLSKYQLGPNSLNHKRRYREDIDYYDIIGPIGFIDRERNEEIFIDCFLEIEEIRTNWFEIDRFEKTGIRNLMQIAYLSSDPNGGLYIGTGRVNSGQIWVVNWDRGENCFLKICDDFNELISSLEQLEN